MPNIRYITRKINLETLDCRIIRQFAEEKGLGKKGFSAALRFIIRDWYTLRMIRITQDKPKDYDKEDSTWARAFTNQLFETQKRGDERNKQVQEHRAALLRKEQERRQL
jgi:hypothetical protein